MARPRGWLSPENWDLAHELRLKCPSAGERINRLWFIRTMEQHLAVKGSDTWHHVDGPGTHQATGKVPGGRPTRTFHVVIGVKCFVGLSCLILKITL